MRKGQQRGVFHRALWNSQDAAIDSRCAEEENAGLADGNARGREPGQFDFPLARRDARAETSLANIKRKWRHHIKPRHWNVRCPTTQRQNAACWARFCWTTTA